MSEFRIRPYTKSQLARLYFPESTEAVARNRMARWIARCRPLLEALESANYSINNHWYTPHQVRLIVEYFGDP